MEKRAVMFFESESCDEIIVLNRFKYKSGLSKEMTTDGGREKREFNALEIQLIGW